MIENDLQKQCIDLIKKKGYEYIHLGFRGKTSYGYSKNNTGYPDLIIFAENGKTLFVELKTLSKLSDKQIEKQEKLINLKHKVHIIKDYETFEKCLNNAAVAQLVE